MEKQSFQSYQEFSEERFTKRIIFKKNDSTAFVLNFMPGQELPAHTHPGTEVYIMMMDGAGTFTVDGVEVAVSEKELLHCGGHEQLAFKNDSSDRVSLYVVLNKIPSEKYAENI